MKDNIIQYNLLTFPRSGNYMTKLILKDFFESKNKKITFCVRCCNNDICKKNSLFKKDHDFKLIRKRYANQKYLILYRRDMIEQLESYFRLIYIQIPNYKNEEDYKNLLNFIIIQKNYYEGFLQKYVNQKKKNTLVIEYNDFLDDPKNNVFKIFKFFDIECTKSEVNTFLDNRKIKIEKKNFLDNELRNRIITDLKRMNLWIL
jgi:hypothetical protein